MRIALISDIHGNCVALEAVLSRIASENVTDIICLGDVASTGPQPREVIARLQELGCPVVMGNMDAWLLHPEMKAQPSLLMECWQDMDVWCADLLSVSDRAYLHSFRPSIEYSLPGGNTLLCYHGSPRSYSERILPTTPDDVLEQAFVGSQASIMVGGHTHVQMFRRYKDMLVLNPGSVGLAMDRVSPGDEIRQPAWAEYAIVECDEGSLRVELQRVAFDLAAFLQAMKASGMPHADWWASRWKEA